MKTRKINLKGDYVNFKREWTARDGNLVAEIGSETKNGNIVQVNVRLDFDCLAYIMPGLKKAWETEKAIRMSSINEVDAALGL